MNEFHHLGHAQSNWFIVVIHIIARAVSVAIAIAVAVAVAVAIAVAIAIAIAIAIGFDCSHRRNRNHAIHGNQLAHGERYVSELHPLLPQIAHGQHCFRVTTK